MNRRIITNNAIRSLLVFLFAYTALSKLFEHGFFNMQLERFPWLSPAAGYISWAVPLTELATTVLLFFPATIQYGLYASFALLALFTIYLIFMLALNTNLPCSCGGVVGKLGWQQHIVFNFLFIALCIVGIFLNKKQGK